MVQSLQISTFNGTVILLKNAKSVLTYVCLMQGMFTQFAAATAAKGTYLPIKGGADCRITDVCILIKLHTLPSIANIYVRRRENYYYYYYYQLYAI